MRRFNIISEQAAANSESKLAYTQLYSEKFNADHHEAVRELLPALRCADPALGLTARASVSGCCLVNDHQALDQRRRHMPWLFETGVVYIRVGPSRRM